MTSTGDDSDPKFEVLLDYLKRNRGFDFRAYKRSSLMRRMVKRMNIIGLQDFARYMDYLEVHPGEFADLFNTVLINVTAFFRDADAWQYISNHIVPKIIENVPAGAPIRLWSAGCASGQEAFTVAMVLCEALGQEAFHERVKIYATDIDEEALAQARQASYSLTQMENVFPALREKYFNSSGDRFVFRQDLRRSVIFGRHDLVNDAPISHLDLLICRNTLMYLNAETQSRIISRFNFALNPGGYLFLGKAEMLLGHSTLFAQVDPQNRVFAKRVQKQDTRIGTQSSSVQLVDHSEKYARLRDLCFDIAAPGQIVVDNAGKLRTTNETARSILGIEAGDSGKLFRDLEVSYKPLELRSLIDQCLTNRSIVKVEKVGGVMSGSKYVLDVELFPLMAHPAAVPSGVGIYFEDVTEEDQLSHRLKFTHGELETTNQELQSTNEELETTNEELQSTNEELETTNAELQSANGELESINRELHGTNQALESTNQDLFKLAGELDARNVFLQAILSSIPSGVIVIDNNQRVIVWNSRSEDLWGLRSDEVQLRPVADLEIGLPLEQILKIVTAESKGVAFDELRLLATNRRGKEITCEVRITPSFDVRNQGGFIILVDEISDEISPDLPD